MKGGDLAAFATGKEVLTRKLKESENYTTKPALSVFTGNNLALDEDMGRRFLIAEQEHLGRLRERQFSRTPVQLVQDALRQRPRIIAAALTAAAAAIRYAPPVSGLPSFEDWSHVIPRTIAWLGRPDPCVAQERNGGEDDESSKFRAFVNSVRDWRERTKGDRFPDGFSAHDLALAAMAIDVDGNPVESDLYQAAATIAPSGSYLGKLPRVDATKRSYFLRGIMGKPLITRAGVTIFIVRLGKDNDSGKRSAVYDVEVSGSLVAPRTTPAPINVFKAHKQDQVCCECGRPAHSARAPRDRPMRWYCEDHIPAWKLTPRGDATPAVSVDHNETTEGDEESDGITY